MSKNCELCGKPLDEWPAKKAPVMSGEQRMTAWITGLIAAGLVCMGDIGYKACIRDKDLDQARLPIEIAARAAADEAQRVKAESAKAEVQLREESRRAIYKACLA